MNKIIFFGLIFLTTTLWGQSYRLTGMVLKKASDEPIAKIKVILRNLSDYKSYEFVTDESGQFEFGVLPEKKYQLETQNKYYFVVSTDFFEIKDTLEHKNIYLEAINLGKSFALENIRFTLGEPELLNCSWAALDNLFDLMRLNPQIHIEIACHTDSRGDDNYNLELTQIQAKKIKDFLVKKGVNPKRIDTVGYGEQFLINHCKNNIKCTNLEHLQNRRVEYTIIGLD